MFVRIGIVGLDVLQILAFRDDFSNLRVHELLVITAHALSIDWAFSCGFMIMALNDLKKWEAKLSHLLGLRVTAWAFVRNSHDRDQAVLP